MAFDKDIPTARTSLRASNPQILENQESLQEAISNEHTFEGTSAGTQTGDHTQGSARCFFAATAPAVRIDGNNFIVTDNGSFWVNDGDNALSILTDFSQGVAADKWTLVSDEVIAVLLAANRVFAGTLGVNGNFEVGTGSEFTVDAATGNTAIAGTADVTGVLTTTAPATLGDGSVLAAATEISDTARTITDKAYVDFSSLTTLDADSAAIVKDTTYTAVTDGFIRAKTQLLTMNHVLSLTVSGDVVSIQEAEVSNSVWKTVYSEIAAGETFLITADSGTMTAFWRSKGTLSEPTK